MYLTPNPTTEPAAATLAVSSLAFGASRDFSDSFVGTYVERDRGYVNLSYFYSGQVLVIVEGSAGPSRYPQIRAIEPKPFSVLRVDGSVFTEYRFTNAFGLNATARYATNISESTTSGLAGLAENLQWKQFEAYAGFRWLM